MLLLLIYRCCLEIVRHGRNAARDGRGNKGGNGGGGGGGARRVGRGDREEGARVAAQKSIPKVLVEFKIFKICLIGSEEEGDDGVGDLKANQLWRALATRK